MASALKPPIFVCLLIFLTLQASAVKQRMLCETITDVALESESTSHGSNGENHGSESQGRNRNRRPTTRRRVYEEETISDIVARRVQEELSAIMLRLDELQRNLTALSRCDEGCSRSSQDAAPTCDPPNIIYDGTCYTVHYPPQMKLDREGADGACRRNGSKLAEIYDRTQQEMLENTIRQNFDIPASEHWYFWIGMTYDETVNVLRYPSGRNVPLNRVIWWPGYPQGSRKYMLLAVKRRGSDGVYNDMNCNAGGVICEKKL